ncbi:MAG: glucose-1-phosphate thymidylyltransferase [Candidatus Eisenbacteria bacterium]
MKGLILSGGKGTRLRPITFTSAKQLVPVANKPILFYGIEAIRDAGITDVGIVVGETRNEIKAAVGDGSAFGIRVTYIEQEAPLGLAHAVKVSRDFLQNDVFVMFLGDNLIKQGITRLVEEFTQEKPNCMILLAEVGNPSEFGVAELRSGRVFRLEEKPKKPASNLALVGVYMFDSSVFEAVDNIKPSWRNELEITDAIQYLIDKKLDVRSHTITGWWKDTGKLEDLLEANRMILLDQEARIEGTVDGKSEVQGSVVVGKDSRVIDSVLRGPLIVGQGCEIEHAYVGPFTSILDNVTIRKSEIEHSIVLTGSKILEIGCRIQGSLIGRDSEIVKVSRKPHCFSFMVGDSSRIEVA